MHLLVATHDLYPDPGSGGTGRYVYEVGRRLVDRGHRVTVLTRRRGDVPRRGTVAGMAVHRIDLSIAGKTAPAILSQLPQAARAVRWAIRRAAPDLLSLQAPVLGQLADALAPADVPRSCTFHSPWATEYAIRTRDGAFPGWRRGGNVTLRRVLERRLLGRTDDVVTLSRYMRQQLRDQHGEAIEPAVVPGGVDADEFHPDAADEATDHPAPDLLAAADTAVLTVRRLSPRMGHELLLRAFANNILHEGRNDVHLFLAGDGPLRAGLERLATDLGITDRVSFLGYVPDAALPAVHATADLFVIPTTELEGFGLATLEAMASGTPMIATPVGGTVEILADAQQREALPEPMLARAAEPQALAERLVAWLDLEPEQRVSAGAACRRHAVELYPWERVVDAFEARYTTLVEGDRTTVETAGGSDERAEPTTRRWQVQR